MPTEIELKFGDGDYLFALRLPQILELQRLCGAGIFTIYGRVLKGRYVLESGLAFGVPHECEAYVSDVHETVRLGLIGGGKARVNGEDVIVTPGRARELIETYCHTVPLRDAWDFAAAVLSATIEGYEPEKKSPTQDVVPPKARSTKRKSSQTARE